MRKTPLTVPAIKRGVVVAALAIPFLAIPFLVTFSSPNGVTVGFSEAAADETNPVAGIEDRFNDAIARGVDGAGRVREGLGDSGERFAGVFNSLRETYRRDPWDHGGTWGHGDDPWGLDGIWSEIRNLHQPPVD